MAIIEERIYFESGLPEEKLIIQKLKESTGLDLNVRKGFISHPNLKNEILYQFDKKNKAIVILYYVTTMFYLKAAIISVLINLGGRYSNIDKLPKWSNLKWIDRKWWQFIPK